MAEFRTIRTGGTLVDLDKLVTVALEQGWQPQGQPFRDPDAREWCQAMVHREPRPAGTVKIKEPKKLDSGFATTG